MASFRSVSLVPMVVHNVVLKQTVPNVETVISTMEESVSETVLRKCTPTFLN